MNQLQNVKKRRGYVKRRTRNTVQIGDSLKDCNTELQDRVVQVERRSESFKSGDSNDTTDHNRDKPFQCKECDISFETEL